jgi:hypothetical protein
MGKVFDASLLGNRTIIEIVALISLALAAVIILRQIHQVTAATNSGQPINIISTHPQLQSPLPRTSASAVDSSNSASNSSSNTITVNGQTVTVPQNGSLSQTINTGDTTATINAQNTSSSTSSQGQSTNTSHSSVNVRVNSNNSSQDSL